MREIAFEFIAKKPRTVSISFIQRGTLEVNFLQKTRELTYIFDTELIPTSIPPVTENFWAWEDGTEILWEDGTNVLTEDN